MVTIHTPAGYLACRHADAHQMTGVSPDTLPSDREASNTVGHDADPSILVDAHSTAFGINLEAALSSSWQVSAYPVRGIVTLLACCK